MGGVYQLWQMMNLKNSANEFVSYRQQPTPKVKLEKNKPWELFQDFKFILGSILQLPSVYKHVSFEVQLTYFS